MRRSSGASRRHGLSSTIRGLIYVYDDVALLEITDPSETTLDAIQVPAAG